MIAEPVAEDAEPKMELVWAYVLILSVETLKNPEMRHLYSICLSTLSEYGDGKHFGIFN